MQIFRGRFTTEQREASYRGHRVQVEFEERVDLASTSTTPSQPPAGAGETAPPSGQEHLFKPAIRNAAVSSDGTFEIELPALDRLREPIRLELKAPDEAVLHRDNLTLEQLAKPYEAAVEPKASLGIEAHPDRFKGLRAKLTGRVFDREGGQPFAGLQVIVWAKHENEEQFRPVAVAFTDNSGYFTTELPREKFAEAYGQISQVPDEKIPIRLEDGALPERLILVVPLAQARLQSSNECGCARMSQAVLDPIDLVSSPGAYSSLEVGGGKCVEFTIPNRTLEEFSYYKIIRTTDPQIRGLTITEPASLPPRRGQ